MLGRERDVRERSTGRAEGRCFGREKEKKVKKMDETLTGGSHLIVVELGLKCRNCYWS